MISKDWTDKERLEVIQHLATKLYDDHMATIIDVKHTSHVMILVTLGTSEFLEKNRQGFIGEFSPYPMEDA